ncbi:MAG: hypothetical protein KJZ83_00495 [Burkholderiaceae bacterium]|nr:hypothetical protein [Burkholderiaceae bacterium]
MTDFNAPDLVQLEHLCHFAEIRLKQLDGEVIDDDDGPPPEDWEWECLHNAVAWLKALKEITPQQEVAMALAVLKKHKVQPNIRYFLDLSTAHLTEDTRKRWSDGEFDKVLSYDANDYGWWLWTGTENEMLGDIPEDLMTVIAYARNIGCDWIKFDCDGEHVAGLTVYDSAED